MKFSFVKYAGHGYVELKCPKGHMFKWKLRVTEPPCCPVCEGMIENA